MERTKQIEITRKRNAVLSEQLKDLQLKLECNQQLNAQGLQAAKDLIQELESVRASWMDALNRIYDMEGEYQGLLSDMKEIKERLMNLNKTGGR